MMNMQSDDHESPTENVGTLVRDSETHDLWWSKVYPWRPRFL